MSTSALEYSINPCYNPDCRNNDHTKMPPISSLDELIAALRQVFDSSEVNVDYVQALMESYKSNPLDWRRYAKFDAYRYTRNLVDEGNGKYNLMVLCWGEGHGSAIHDHADAHCFMKVLHGSLSEVRFAWPEEGKVSEGEGGEEGMREISRNQLKTNSVCYMSDELGLHRVENPSHTEPAVSLHLYCPPFSACSMFDQRTGRRTNAPVTFWSKYGEKVTYPRTAPTEDN
jgi:cysteine dioxygenase